MERTLPDWLPDDAPWTQLNTPTLEKQCTARNIPVSSHKGPMIERLESYGITNAVETRHIPWAVKPSDPYLSALKLAHDNKFRIVQAKRMGTPSRKHFQVTRDGEKLVEVNIKHWPSCTCMGRGFTDPACVHVIYVLRYVLNCPEPLRWQVWFLSPELSDIYRHSYAVSTLLLTEWKDQDPLCALCFKVVAATEEHRTCCVTCGRAMHTDCVNVANKVKKPASKDHCWRCEDETEWSIEKFREPGEVRYPLIVPGTKAPILNEAVARPAESTTQQSRHDTTSNSGGVKKGLDSSHSNHSGEQRRNSTGAPLQTSNPDSTAPSDVNSNSLTSERPSKASATQSFPSARFGTSSLTPGPSQVTAALQALPPRPGSLPPALTIAGAAPRPTLFGVTSAVGFAPANNRTPISPKLPPVPATNPTSNATPNVALTPASAIGLVQSPAVSSTNTNTSNRRSVKLARDQRRLSKKSVKLQKKAERAFKKMNKKHRKELKKLGERVERGLKRLKKRCEKLEKEASKLGGHGEGSDDV